MLSETTISRLKSSLRTEYSRGPMTIPADETLALQIQAGSQQALAELVNRHHSPLIGYLYRMLGGNRALAEDLVQETFLRVLRSIHHYKHPRPFKPWLYAIATNLVRDHYKKADTQRTQSILDDGIFQDNISSTPEDSLLAADEAHQVSEAISSLPTHQRETIVLRYYQGLSHREIAEALSIPVGTVKSRLSLGLMRLRELIE